MTTTNELVDYIARLPLEEENGHIWDNDALFSELSSLIDRARDINRSVVHTPVFVANIDHRYGNTVSVHASVEGAKRFIYEWVVENWTLSQGIPKDYEQAIAEYFDLFGGESCSIYPTNVEA